MFFVRPAGAQEDQPPVSSHAPSRLEDRGNVVIGAERLLPIVTVTEEQERVSPRTSTQFGLGPLVEPSSIHEVPRLTFDFVMVERLTVGIAPLFTWTPRYGGTYLIGLAPRVGYVISLTDRVLLWPHAGVEYAYLRFSERTDSHHAIFSGEFPLVFVVAEHAALSLGLSAGTALSRARTGFGATHVNSSYGGLNGGLVTWF